MLHFYIYKDGVPSKFWFSFVFYLIVHYVKLTCALVQQLNPKIDCHCGNVFLLNEMNTSYKTCSVMLNAICVIKLMCSKDRVSSIACLKRDLLS